MTTRPPDDAGETPAGESSNPAGRDSSAPDWESLTPDDPDGLRRSRDGGSGADGGDAAASDSQPSVAAGGGDDAPEAAEIDPVTDTGGMPIPRPPVSRPPAGSAYGYPTRYAEAPGTGHFRLALPQMATIVAGPAAGSMIAGIAAVLAAASVGCTWVFGSIMVPVAATILVVFCISAACLLAAVALRQIKRGGGEYRGKGMAITGVVCGGAAVIVLLFMLVILSVALR